MATITPPANVNYGTVTGRFVIDIVDSADAGDEPDFVVPTGTITFVASVGKLLDATALPDPLTILRYPITGILDAQGYLCTPLANGSAGARGLKLIATDDTDLNPTGWVWNVTYALKDPAARTLSSPAPHKMALPTNTTIDLTTVIPPDSEQAIGIPQAQALAAQAASDAATAEAAALVAQAAAEDASDDAATAVAAVGSKQPIATLDPDVADLIDAPGSAVEEAFAAKIETVTPDTPAVMATRSVQAKDLLGFHMALAQASTTPVDVFVKGTSLLFGQNSANENSRIPTRLVQKLRERYNVPGVRGGRGMICGIGAYGGADTVVGAPTTVASGTASRGAGLGNGKSIQYTNQTCTSFKVFLTRVTTDEITITIDGVPTVLTAGPSGAVIWTSSALAATSRHTIVIAQTNGAGTAVVNNVQFFDGDETTGIRLIDGTLAGSSSKTWLTAQGGSEDWLVQLAASNAAVMILDTIPNDATTAGAALTAAQHKANNLSIIAKARTAKAGLPVVLWGAHRRPSGTTLVEPWENYTQADREIALTTEGVSFFNMDDVLDPFGTFGDYGYLGGDTYHPGAAGYETATNLLFEFLIPPGPGGGLVPTRTFRSAVEVIGTTDDIALKVRGRQGQVADIFQVTSPDGATAYLKVAQDGKVTISNQSFTSLNLADVAGTYRTLQFSTSAAARWLLRATTTAEGGSNSGSNFEVMPRDDAGAALPVALSIVRATSQVAIGNLKVAMADGSAPTMLVDAPAGINRDLSFTTAGSTRWILRATSTAEGGSNAGSDLSLLARSDAGGVVGTVFTITRSTMRINLGEGVDLALGATTGTKIGTGTTNKLAFYGKTPVIQPSGTPAAATDAATTQALVNDLRTKLIALGLVA